MMRKSAKNQKKPGGFPDRLRELRVQKNLSQAELAKLTGISGIHISRYERGVSTPTAARLQKLAEIFEVSGDYLYEGAQENAARVSLENRKVLELFRDVENLPEKDRDYVLQVLDDVVTTRKFKIKVMSSG